jgi:hypothetical protein
MPDKPRGYFGVGIYGSKWETNIGTLWRAAHLYGAVCKELAEGAVGSLGDLTKNN